MSIRKKYIAEFVYGAIDGTITTFAVMAGALGAQLSAAVVLILGLANLFADGFSMAVSNYLSERSDARVHPDADDDDGKHPVKTAAVTFTSFVVVGFIPLVSFVFAPLHPFIANNRFGLSAGLTAVAFAGVGYARGWVTSQNRLLAVIETLLIGGAAAVIAFGVGYLLRGFAG